MTMLHRKNLFWSKAAFVLCACGPVSESDPQFWLSTSDPGGKKYEFGPSGSTGGDPQASTGGVPDPGPSGGGASPVPTGSGGATASGGASPTGGTIGSGGFVASGGQTASGGATAPEPTGSGDPPDPPPPGPVGPCNLTFTVTTVTARGRYAPRNVGAIWISDAQGKFVKALEVWGQQRLSNATAWVQASAGAKVDVVTAATKPSHGAHSVNWDCQTPGKQPVPAGTYQAHVTFAESDAFPFFGPAPIQASMDFTRSGTTAEADGTDTANFTKMHVSIR
jgi:hypothetical protein